MSSLYLERRRSRFRLGRATRDATILSAPLYRPSDRDWSPRSRWTQRGGLKPRPQSSQARAAPPRVQLKARLDDDATSSTPFATSARASTLKARRDALYEQGARETRSPLRAPRRWIYSPRRRALAPRLSLALTSSSRVVAERPLGGPPFSDVEASRSKGDGSTVSYRRRLGASTTLRLARRPLGGCERGYSCDDVHRRVGDCRRGCSRRDVHRVEDSCEGCAAKRPSRRGWRRSRLRSYSLGKRARIGTKLAD